MGDDRPGGTDGQDRKGPVDEDNLADRMRRLSERLDRSDSARNDKARPARTDNAGFAYAMRLSTEFVAAILVGAAIGWGIDRLLGSAPWAMVILLLLGFCAGVLNVMRAAGRIADPYARPAHKDGSDRGSDAGSSE